jgi:PPM family protein phosphatase
VSGPQWRLSAAGLSNRGLVRERNEDAFYIDQRRGLFIVADGLGRYNAGHVASRLAVEAFGQSLGGWHEARPTPEDVLNDAVLAAHKVVSAAAARLPEHQGMRTTLTAAWRPPGESALWAVHVGDSRVYRLRRSRLELLTEDHTIFNELRRSGALPENREEWPNRAILSQAVGDEPWISPEFCHCPLAAGDRILLCTDGLTDMLDQAALREALNGTASPAGAAEALVRAANERGGRDNITVIVVDVVDEER